MSQEAGAAVVTAGTASTPESSDLLARARAGDVAAFEGLYRENSGRVYATCLRLLADPTRAEEAAQAAFIKAWRKLPGFEGRSRFSTWLHRLTVNVVLDELRAEKRRAFTSLPEDDGGPGGDRMAELPSIETALDLERAIALLPPGARTAFVLHDVQGYRHREIADLTGTAEGTWKAQLHRARKLLREALKDE